jgi:hypothetical protein
MKVIDMTPCTLGHRFTTGHPYDHKKIINKLINQDVLLRTPISQVRRHIDDGRPEDTARKTHKYMKLICTVQYR